MADRISFPESRYSQPSQPHQKHLCKIGISPKVLPHNTYNIFKNFQN